MATTGVSSEQIQVRICEAAAVMMLDGGIDALSGALVADAAGVTKARVLRRYTSRAELVSGIYLHGHARIAAVCDRRSRRTGSGVDAVVALTYDLLEQASADPLARVVHCLEATRFAVEKHTDTDVSIIGVYRLWHEHFYALLRRGDDCSVDETDDGRVVEVVELLVAAVAGFCDPRRFYVSTLRERMDRLHVVLVAVIPTLYSDTARAEHMRHYLTRVHDAVDPSTGTGTGTNLHLVGRPHR